MHLVRSTALCRERRASDVCRPGPSLLAPGAPPRTLLGRESHRGAERHGASARDGGWADGILRGAQARCGGGSRTEQTLEQTRDAGAPQALSQAAQAADPRAPCPPRSASSAPDEGRAAWGAAGTSGAGPTQPLQHACSLPAGR